MSSFESVSLRLATPADYQMIMNIFNSKLDSSDGVAFPENFKLTKTHLKKNTITASPSFWAIEFKGKVCGFAYHHYMKRCKTVSMAGGLMKNMRQMGLGTAAFKKYLKIIIEKLPITRVEAGAPAPNVASNRILQKVGFKLEGTQRSAVLIGTKAYDYNLYGILKDEFEN